MALKPLEFVEGFDALQKQAVATRAPENGYPFKKGEVGRVVT